MGYDVAYATNIDVDADPALLMGRKLFASMGHDEYWSLGERRNVQNARDAGVSLGFFSANTAYWRIRLEPSASGTPRRIITCYKDRNLDPIHDAEDTTVRFRDGPHAQPENALIGQMYELYMQIDGFPLVIGDSHHWVYDGTGLSDGDTLTHVVGYEWDHVFADHNSPAGLEVVATSPVFGAYGSDAVSNVTLYAPTSSSIVFSAGTIQWAWGLGKAGYEDTRIQKITENVLARAGLVPHIHTVVSPPPPPTDIGVASKVTVVVGSGTAGHADGNFASASFAVPAGVAVDAHGNLLVTEARNHRVRKITPNGVVSTVAGCGPDDQTGSRRSTDGKQGKACFDTPTGIAVGLDGRVFVSDSHNHRIRVLDEDGNVQTYAGTGTADLVDSPNRKLAAFSYPRGLAIGPDGALYVADAGNGAIRRVTDDGVTTVVQGGDEVTGVAVAPDGTVYAIESAANQVAVLQGEMLVPIVNALGIPGDQNGPGNSALLRPADGIVVDGNALIVSDSVNQKIRRIALTPDHTVTTLVGDGNCGLRVGTGATTRLRNPRGIALWNGAYFVADSDNHRVLRVDP
jgi:sugar lactone lactonase YvrE